MKEFGCTIVLIALFFGAKNLHWAPYHSGRDLGCASPATFSIDSKYGTAGKGILVGYKDGKRERVFLLTARHVATFKDIIERDMILYLDWTKKWKVSSKKDRWITCRREIDAAWMELNDEELAELRDRDLLNFIPLDEILNYSELLANSQGERFCAKMFFKGGVETGDLVIEVPRSAPIPFRFNHNLLVCDIPIVRVYSDTLTTPGDSGCPTFIKTSVGWSLIGLVVAGNDKLRINAVMPLDEVISAIKRGGFRLCDYPALW